MDLFGESLIGDLMDAPTSVPAENPAMDSSQPEEVDLFADATFVSAPVQVEAKASSQNKVRFLYSTYQQVDRVGTVPYFWNSRRC